RPPTRARPGRSGPRSAAGRPPRPRAARPPSRVRPAGQPEGSGEPRRGAPVDRERSGGARGAGGGGGRGGGPGGGGGHELPAPALALALDVDQPFLAGAHEPLELLLELGVLGGGAGACALGLPVGGGLLDRQVDLAVLLDSDDLDRDLVIDPEVLLDRADVVPVDLGDVDETRLARLKLDEGSVGCDPNDGARDNRPD